MGRKNFRLNRVALAALTLVSALQWAGTAHAGPGYVDATSNTGAAFRLPTYFANSPSGLRDNPVPEAATLGLTPDTGTALRKFVDPLPLVGAENARTLAADAAAAKYLPRAVVAKWVNPQGVATGDDYVELAVVEYREKFHSDLAAAATLRGFVQIDVEASNGRPSVLAGSRQLPLVDAQGNALKILATDANGKLVKDAGGQVVKVAALAVDAPHYLGPVVNATSGVPMRVKVHNLLPAGRAVVDNGGAAPVVTQRNGDHFLPFDPTLLGAGVGPDGITSYTQNRVNFHVQGIDAPWISAGLPHQWFTPAGEADAALPGSLAAQFAGDPNRDPAYLESYLRGASTMAVPDMNDPGPGAMTYYFANQEGSRFLWANDKTLGQGRLNTYAGMVLPYVVTDAAEQQMVAGGLLPPAERTLPLILQDKTFVPKDIGLQDAKWNTSAWGGEGSLWYPHVYEPVQGNQQMNNWNQVGRWYYGPLFWPIFPAQYEVPDGAYPNPSFTPEAFFDTPVVNGVAYPTVEVEPTTYRLRIVNASNDRWMTFNLFQGKVTAQLADGTPVTNPLGIASEVDMIQATAPTPQEACADPDQVRPDVDSAGNPTPICTPATWPYDSRTGGVAAPSAVGPSLHQFANEGGLLAKVATIHPTPLFYIMDKGRATVLNPDTPALFLSPGDVADVVVDFSQYAGKSLLAYNDSGAPEPGADPRNFYYTGVGDQSDTGGAENTKPGYGPNVRTMMQFKVKAAMNDGSAPTAAWDKGQLDAAVGAAYTDPATGQERPIVAQPEYQGFDASWASIPLGPATQEGMATAYADIYTTTLKNPFFEFVPGTPNPGFNSVKVTQRGSGYRVAPAVTITGDGQGAQARASLKISTVTVTNPGGGYTSAPAVTIGTPAAGMGSGALAEARLAPNLVTVSNGGAGYTSAPQVKFSVQPGAVAPVAEAVVSGGKVTGVNIISAGSGYTVVPTVTFIGGGATTAARASVTAGIGEVRLVAPYPVTPSSIGGGGYTDLTAVAITFAGGAGAGAAAEASGEVFEISVTDFGSGYQSPPAVTLEPSPTGDNAFAEVDLLNGGPTGKVLAKAKSIQELFEPSFGRYNSTQGVELPYTTAFTQTTIPLGYVDTPTELVNEGDFQVWKYVHNGLFCQPVEFNGYNVQIVNRVGWDGFVVPPLPNEIGWKSVLRVNPLEDAIIALRPKKTRLPGFALPTSVRAMDPTQPLGSPFGFSQFDPATGLAAPVVNDIVDYRHEGVVGNTMGSRAAVDFNRPVIYNAKDLAPLAPSGVAAEAVAGGVKVGWIDATPPENGDNPQAEVGFRVQVGVPGSDAWKDLAADLRAVNGMAGAVNALANATQYLDSSVQTLPPPAAPNTPTGTAGAPRSLTLQWTLPAGGAAGVAGLRVLRAQVAADGVALGAFTDLGVLLPAAATSYTDLTVAPGTVYQYEVVAVGSGSAEVIYRVVAVNAMGESASAASAPVASGGQAQDATSQPSALIATPLAAPVFGAPAVVLGVQAGVYTATLQFGAVDGAAGYMVRWRVGNQPNGGIWSAWTAQAGTTTEVTLNPGQFVSFQVYALSPNVQIVNGASQPIVSATVSTGSVRMALPPLPNNLALSAITPTTLNLAWNGSAGATFEVTRATDPAFTQDVVVTPTGGATSLAVTGLNPSTRYYFQVSATNGLGTVVSGSVNAWTLANPVAAAPTVSTLAANSLVLNWVAPAGGASSYVVQRANNAAFNNPNNTVVAGNLNALTVNNLNANATYFFRVVARNGANVAAAASPATVQLTLPGTPGNLNAVRGTVGAPTTGALTWNTVAGLGYEVQWANANNMAGATLVSPAVSGQQIDVGGVPRNVYLQVRAVNASGPGAWSGVRTVQAR